MTDHREKSSALTLSTSLLMSDRKIVWNCLFVKYFFTCFFMALRAMEDFNSAFFAEAIWVASPSSVAILPMKDQTQPHPPTHTRLKQVYKKIEEEINRKEERFSGKAVLHKKPNNFPPSPFPLSTPPLIFFLRCVAILLSVVCLSVLPNFQTQTRSFSSARHIRTCQ